MIIGNHETAAADLVTISVDLNDNSGHPAGLPAGATLIVKRNGVAVKNLHDGAAVGQSVFTYTETVAPGTYTYVIECTTVGGNTTTSDPYEITVTAVAGGTSYAEVVTFTPGSVAVNGYGEIKVTGGKPNTKFNYTCIKQIGGVPITPSGLNSTLDPTLDANGEWKSGQIQFVTLQSTPSEIYSVSFHFLGTAHYLNQTVTCTTTGTGAFNEIVTVTPSVAINSPSSVTITGGMPGDTVTVSGTGVGALAPISQFGLQLDATGSYYANRVLITSSNQNTASVPYTLTFVFTNSGNTRTATFTGTNAVTQGTEIVSIAPGSIAIGESATITITGGLPNTTFTYTGGWAGTIISPAPANASLAGGSGTLNASGGATVSLNNPLAGSYQMNQAPGSWSYGFHFNGTQHDVAVNFTGTDPNYAPPPALSVGSYNPGYGLIVGVSYGYAGSSWVYGPFGHAPAGITESNVKYSWDKARYTWPYTPVYEFPGQTGGAYDILRGNVIGDDLMVYGSWQDCQFAGHFPGAQANVFAKQVEQLAFSQARQANLRSFFPPGSVIISPMPNPVTNTGSGSLGGGVWVDGGVIEAAFQPIRIANGWIEPYPGQDTW